MPVPKVSEPPAAATVKRLAQQREVRESEPLAVAIALGQQRVRLIPELTELYNLHLPKSVATAAKGSADKTSKLSSKEHEAQRVREAAIWALGELRDHDLLPVMSSALRDPALSVRCIATLSLEKMIIFESSQPLRAAFSHAQKSDECPQVVAPHQEGARPPVLMSKMSYQLALMRAIATTDDPELFQWMYEQSQRDLHKKAKVLMIKYHKKLTKLDQNGRLREHKRKLKRRASRESLKIK